MTQPTGPAPASPLSARARALRRWALLAVLPTTLVAAELLVRLADVGPARRPSIQGSVVRAVDDPRLRFLPDPGAERTVDYPAQRGSPARRVVQRVNAQGFRGPELSPTKPADTLRILCLGDSHTWGEGVDDSLTWPALLGAELGRSLGVPVEMINAGVLGYDTVQQALLLERHALAFDPDLILLQFFMNDATQRDGVDAGAGDRAGLLLRLAHPRRQGLVGRLRRHSRLADGLLEGIFRRGYFDHWSAGNTDRLTDSSASWIRWTEAMDGIASLLDDRGLPLAVVLYPFLHGDGSGLASDDAHRRVSSWLRGRSIAHFDARAAFVGRDLEALRVHPGDLHAGADANRLFAGAVGGWLRRWAPFQAAIPRPAGRRGGHDLVVPASGPASDSAPLRPDR